MNKYLSTNRICECLCIDLPLIQAPMNYISGPNLVAAVSKAGGMGVLGPNALKRSFPDLSMEQRTEICFRKIREQTDRPFGVNVVIPSDLNDTASLQYAERVVDCSLSAGVKAFFCVDGINEHIYNKIKKSNAIVVSRPITPTVNAAKLAQEMGADIFIATGTDEGGWLPKNHIGTFSIVPVIADAIDIPIVAAGGINEIRGVRAAFALGAEGIYVGTRFIASSECDASEEAKKCIVNAKSEDLIFVGDQQRSIPTPFARKIANNPLLLAEANPLRSLRAGMYDGAPANGTISVNTSIDLIREIKSSADIVQELMADWLCVDFP